MTDVVGQQLAIGDFVTAIWANAELALFEVIDLIENGRLGAKRRGRGDVLVLKRAFVDKHVKESTQWFA